MRARDRPAARPSAELSEVGRAAPALCTARSREVCAGSRAPSLSGAPGLAHKHTHGFGEGGRKKKKVPYRMRFFSSSIGSSPWSSLKLFDSLAAQRHDPPGPASSGRCGARGRGSRPTKAACDSGTRGAPRSRRRPLAAVHRPARSRAARGAKQRCALGFPAN